MACWVAALVVSVRRMVRRRLAFWVPLVAVLAWFVLVLVGAGVATSAMPS